MDEGYDPQGLAMVGGQLILSGYRSDSPYRHQGPCRLFLVEPSSGRQVGTADVSAPCGHAGGLAISGNGRLYVADTNTLFESPSGVAFQPDAPRYRALRLVGFHGALAASGDDHIWIGTYEENKSGLIYKFRTSDLDGLDDGASLDRSKAIVTINIGDHAQGAAEDPDGQHIWISRSDLSWGYLDLINLSTNALERSYALPGGIEGLSFDPLGRLWVVSESGARHYYDTGFGSLYSPFYPVVFLVDKDRLKAD